MPMTPSERSEWATLTQMWQPPEGSPIKPEDYVMKPVVFRGGTPGIVAGAPGGGDERYRDLLAPAFQEFPGAGVPVKEPVAGRDAYVGTYRFGWALLTTNGCWSVAVLGENAASVRAIAAELLRPTTVSGRRVAASRS